MSTYPSLMYHRRDLQTTLTFSLTLMTVYMWCVVVSQCCDSFKPRDRDYLSAFNWYWRILSKHVTILMWHFFLFLTSIVDFQQCKETSGHLVRQRECQYEHCVLSALEIKIYCDTQHESLFKGPYHWRWNDSSWILSSIISSLLDLKPCFLS